MGGGRPCSICVHPDRHEIDRLLVVHGMNMQEIGRVFKVNPRSLSRHKSIHLSALLRRAAVSDHVASEEKRGASLIQQVDSLKERSIGILDQAEKTKSLPTAVMAVREARACIETMAKLMGAMDQGTTINVFNGPAWVNMQTNILTALLPYPDAKNAVLRAIMPPIDV